MMTSASQVFPKFRGQACEQVPEEADSSLHSLKLDGRGAPQRPQSLLAKLSVIGWGVREMERRSGISRGRIARWCRDPSLADPRFVARIDELAEIHTRLANPFSRGVPASGNRPALNGRAVTHAILVIGWSERTLAERMGEHRTSLRRILDGQGQLTPRNSRWLEALSDAVAECVAQSWIGP